MNEFVRAFEAHVPKGWSDERKQAVPMVAALLGRATREGLTADPDKLVQQAVQVVSKATDQEVRALVPRQVDANQIADKETRSGATERPADQ